MPRTAKRTMTITKSIQDKLSDIYGNLCYSLTKNLEDTKSLHTSGIESFQVTITSNWPNEEAVTVSKTKVAPAMKEAKEQYRAANNRSNIDGKVEVWAILSNSSRYAVPERHWKEYWERN